jgi:hypothetical protein
MEEALYLVQFQQPDGTFYSSGVVVLETNRFFGGDSAFVYTGHYNMMGTEFVVTGVSARHSGAVALNAFGDMADSFEFRIEAHHRDGRNFEGEIIRNDTGARVGVRLTFIVPLP